MDNLEQYRKIVKEILTEHAQIATTTDTVKIVLTRFSLNQPYFFQASNEAGHIRPGSDYDAVNFQEPYLKTVFGFIGITDIRVINANGLNTGLRDQEQLSH